LQDVIGTAGVVVLDRDRVLLIERGEGAGHITGSWGIPAGRSTPTRPRAAASRELTEETGLRVDEPA
jgi:ADP-ribose pyrophosphatase YjhB (NUDIX family)